MFALRRAAVESVSRRFFSTEAVEAPKVIQLPYKVSIFSSLEVFWYF